MPVFWKLLVITVGVVVIGAALLELRVQRQQLHHQLALLHMEIDRARQHTWDAQVRIAQHSAPATLRETLERAGLDLEPTAPPSPPEALPANEQLVEADHYQWARAR